MATPGAHGRAVMDRLADQRFEQLRLLQQRYAAIEASPSVGSEAQRLRMLAGLEAQAQRHIVWLTRFGYITGA